MFLFAIEIQPSKISIAKAQQETAMMRPIRSDLRKGTKIARASELGNSSKKE
jgi:hypothetical protein